MTLKWPKRRLTHWIFAAVVAGIVVIGITTWGVDMWLVFQQTFTGTTQKNSQLSLQIASISAELARIKNEDQYKKNTKLQEDIGNIEATYTQAVALYEDLLRLKEVAKNTSKFDDRFTAALTLLAGRDYAKATTELSALRTDIKSERDKIAAAFTIPASVPATNNPPAAGGFNTQSVTSDAGQFLVYIVAGDLANTRILVDTASNETCTNNCPVLPLATYVSRSGAYAGVNGSYFCPSTYPSCAGKTNSFDTLLMNKNKVYFNSDNNTYSTVPAVIFGNGFIRFIGASRDWGRDTGIDSMIAMQPLLISGGNIAFGGNSDPKEGAKGSRSFVANRGNTAYIGVVFGATVAESARTLKAMGMENALNLDDGGSTALWFGGYKAGPGRDIPNAVLFVRK